MKQVLDKKRFGPWALVTGASSGIGKELTRQLAANGLNVVIAARRIDLLKELGNGIAESSPCNSGPFKWISAKRALSIRLKTPPGIWISASLYRMPEL